MTIFGLNSPEIFVLLIILLFILGPKRIEKLLTSFPGFIKFLLNDEINYKVIREETADKRTTHWVPEIQTRGVTTQNHL